ncbi:unnamed protein product [Pieris macdunnoughi]|uniref:DDE Tnp4 domain-containing protein n=1 Tax=Pieris macdunnoughi TaxID=345717 RepID=A0A821PQK8_9NEOP|nr:unnamed protein product [Pieris macdunnoughi]
MSLFNQEELAMIAIALDEEEADDQEDHQQAIKRIWVCELIYFSLATTKATRWFEKKRYWRQSISPMERLAVTLRFPTGDSFKTIAFSYRMGFSTVQEIVTKTCKCIVDTMMSEMLPRPTYETWKSIADDFNTLWNFPNRIGALDGKHFNIQSPPNSGSLYFNYKKTFSVVLMALVDANYNFTIVNVGSYGKNSDGGIFANSNLGKELQRKNLSLPEVSIYQAVQQQLFMFL